MWILTMAVAYACEVVDMAATMDVVEAAIDDGDPARGLTHLDQLWQKLPDSCAPASAADLALLAQRAAALAWSLGKEDVSNLWFETACTVAPTLPVPPALGPTAVGRGAGACARVAERSVVTVAVESNVIIDGVPRQAGTQLSLVTGVHLLVLEASGHWKGRWQVVQEEGAILGLPSGNLLPFPDGDSARRLGPAVALAGSGAALSAAGGILFQLAFANRYSTSCAGLGTTVDDWQSCADARDVTLAPGYYGGLGLIVGGAAIGAAGLGLGVRAMVTPTQATVAFAW